MPRAEQSPKVGFSMVIFRGAGGGGGPVGQGVGGVDVHNMLITESQILNQG